MLEKSSQWILPNNLRKTEKREIEAIDNGCREPEGDFGSYYGYFTGISREWIKPHAVHENSVADNYIANLRSAVKRNGFDLTGNVLDVGCAIGTITAAINRINRDGITCGLDISESGIKIAKNQYPSAQFFCQSADELENFPDNHFDVIHCREFYPFTRTNSLEHQGMYLTLFLSKLKPAGKIVLVMIDAEKGFCNTYEHFRKQLTISRTVLLPGKIFKIIGDFAYNQIVHFGLATMLRLIKKGLHQATYYFYVIRKT